MFAIYDRATLYLLLHALALLGTGILIKVYPSAVLLRWVGWSYIART